MKLIERNFNLQKLINVIGTPDIMIITGVRRAGNEKEKTTYGFGNKKTVATGNET